MKFEVHHYHHQSDKPPHWAVELKGLLEKIMASLDETLAAVTAEDTKVDGIIAFLAGIEKQLADALAGVTLPPATQAKVDQIFAQATASAGKIDAAIAAGTPPATPAPPPTT